MQQTIAYAKKVKYCHRKISDSSFLNPYLKTVVFSDTLSTLSYPCVLYLLVTWSQHDIFDKCKLSTSEYWILLVLIVLSHIALWKLDTTVASTGRLEWSCLHCSFCTTTRGNQSQIEICREPLNFGKAWYTVVSSLFYWFQFWGFQTNVWPYNRVIRFIYIQCLCFYLTLCDLIVCTYCGRN